MVLVSEVEPAVFDPRDELADADIISSGGERCGWFAASCWPKPMRLVRSRRSRIIGVPVLAGAVAAATLLATDSQPASSPGLPAQQIAITNTAVRPAGVTGPGGWWIGPSGCQRGRSCPRG